jgi:hypothetical protein
MSAASSQPLNMCLSGPVADFVRAQVATEGFSAASEYINRLVFERQRQKALAPLERRHSRSASHSRSAELARVVSIGITTDRTTW